MSDALLVYLRDVRSGVAGLVWFGWFLGSNNQLPHTVNICKREKINVRSFPCHLIKRNSTRQFHTSAGEVRETKY